jgi:hypothetical protein
MAEQPNLVVRAEEDGTWLEFTTSDGRQATLRVETLAAHERGLAGITLRQWCQDRQAERRPA